MPENWRKRFRVAKNVDGEKHVYAYLRSVKNREEVALYYHNAHGHEPRYVGAGPVIKACKKKLLPPFNMVISANGSNDDNAKHRFNTLVRWIFVLSKQRKSILPKADDFAERLRSLLVFMKDRKAEIDGVTSDEESSEDPDNDSSDTQQNGGDQTTVYSYPLRAYDPEATP